MPFDPMSFVDDVAASSRLYQRLLGARSGHGGDGCAIALCQRGRP